MTLSEAMNATHSDGLSLIGLPETCPNSPIFAILSTKPRSLAAYCQDRGFIVRAVVAPTVPAGTERVRVCLHAGNTVNEVDRFVTCVKEWIQMELSGQRSEVEVMPLEHQGRVLAKI
jgi:8-amino-7-oxononanoate synthase